MVETLTLSCTREDEWRFGYLPVCSTSLGPLCLVMQSSRRVMKSLRQMHDVPLLECCLR